jgi:hypothetical protein
VFEPQYEFPVLWSLLIQSMRAFLTAAAEMPYACSGIINKFENPILPSWQQFYCLHCLLTQPLYQLNSDMVSLFHKGLVVVLEQLKIDLPNYLIEHTFSYFYIPYLHVT